MISRKAVTSWVIYDLANTIYSMGVVSLFLPLWIREQVGKERSDAVYGNLTLERKDYRPLETKGDEKTA